MAAFPGGAAFAATAGMGDLDILDSGGRRGRGLRRMGDGAKDQGQGAKGQREGFHRGILNDLLTSVNILARCAAPDLDLPQCGPSECLVVDILRHRHRRCAPWVIVKSNGKKHARLNCNKHSLNTQDYPGKDHGVATPPDPLIARQASHVVHAAELGVGASLRG